MQSVNVYELTGKSKFNRFHGLILFWCVLILIIDGYDLAVVGAALPAIMDDMGVDATSAGIMAGSALLGTMLGAPARSTRRYWGDRYYNYLADSRLQAQL